MNKELIRVNNLYKTFSSGKAKIQALQDITFSIEEGKTLGIVGESGSGKTTLAKTLLRLTPPQSGEFFFEDKELFSLRRKELFPYREKIQMIFQNPYSSLNPRMNIEMILFEPYLIHNLCKDPDQRRKNVKELLNIVELPLTSLKKYPHEFSGGERQRIAIARALVSRPKFLICDEILSSLDITIQGQIIQLLQRLQNEQNLTLLFISHDLNVVSILATHIGVIYYGNLVEIGTKEEVVNAPLHPYTKALFSSILIPDPKRKKSFVLPGDPPSFFHPPKGCPFASRCSLSNPICLKTKPILDEKGDSHLASCHFSDNE